MKPKYKTYIKLNMVSLFFVAVSFISITLAWFAYSGLATVDTEINVKAWHIKFDSDKLKDYNNIVVSLSEIYPGMETVTETVKIQNLGDSDAQLNYSIVSARILDDIYEVGENYTLEQLQDKLSHEYPFHINISLDKNYVFAKGEDGVFNVSISWPLDSNTDLQDSEWGNNAYNFQDEEAKRKQADNNYQIRTTIKIVISVTAEQYIQNNEAIDTRYNLGDLVLYDVKENRFCETAGGSCLRTNVIDINSKIGDTTIALLPNLDDNYGSGQYSEFDTLMSSNTYSELNTLITANTKDWNVVTRRLTTDDILNVISTNIIDSVLVRESISDSLIGYLGYNDRITNVKGKASMHDGESYFSFQNPHFIYFSTGKCYWTYDEFGYNASSAFALKRIDLSTSKLYAENMTTECGVIPVIVAPKEPISEL